MFFRTFRRIIPPVALLGTLALSAALAARELLPEEAPENLGGPVNSAGDEFSPSVTEDGSVMVFNAKRAGERYQNLYFSKRTKTGWSEPRAFSGMNSKFNDEAPFLTPDGKLLFFASDRDGSFEMPKDAQGRVRVSFDLYMSSRTPQGWTPPRKISSPINSIHHERSPTFDVETRTLFFARWKFGDPSGSKLYAAEFTEKGFGEPQELPATINSGHREAAFVPQGGGLFHFASTRPGGRGGFDLYAVERDDSGAFGEVRNAGPVVNSEGDDIYFSRRGDLFYLSSNRPGGKGRYDIYGKSAVMFEKTAKGEVFTTRSIHFAHDSAELRPNSHAILDKLIAYLKQRDELRLEITGHTDLNGKPDYNLDLSRRRALSVRDYLVRTGKLSEDRFVVRGAGMSEPIVAKKGPGFDHRNRRTEFRVLN